MPSVLVVSSDVVDENMGGMGVRSWELAHALASSCKVILAVPGTTSLQSDAVRVVGFDLQRGDLRPWALESNVIVLQGSILHFHPYLRDLGIALAVDLYTPNLLESLVWHDRDEWKTWIPAYEEYLRLQIDLIRAGDFFFCASERQRDYWLGWLHACKRLNPHTYRQDPTFRTLIDVIPFGLPSASPAATHPVLKGVHPEIASTDRVILWSGGLWDWLDPFTLIRAVGKLVPLHPELKLFFMGTRHPNAQVQDMSMPERAAALARELGLLDRSVFFNDWVPYGDRVNYLLEADLAVVTHANHIETHFSFRTRVLDCIWTGLPLVVTQGDSMADWVEVHHLGRTVPAENVDALAIAIDEMLGSGGRQVYANAFGTLRDALRWSEVVRPLERFCLDPRQTPDRGQYLTEAERLGLAKDGFLEQVIRDKDAFLDQVVKAKDAAHRQALEEVSLERDAALEGAYGRWFVWMYHKITRRLRRA